LDKNNRDGPKHKIIAGDAIQYLEDCQVTKSFFTFYNFEALTLLSFNVIYI
jgi:hypothetical protein